MSFYTRLEVILSEVKALTELNLHNDSRILLCTGLIDTFTIDDQSELHMIRGNYRIIEAEANRVNHLPSSYADMRRETDTRLKVLLDKQFTRPVRKIIMSTL